MKTIRGVWCLAAVVAWTMVSLVGLAGELNWQAPAQGGTREGNILTVALTQKGTAMFAAPFDFTPWKGKVLKATVRSKGTNVLEPRENWLGYKFMFHYHDARTGFEEWPGSSSRTGSWDWTETVVRIDLQDREPRDGRLQLGLQDTAGTVSFDLSSLRFEEEKPLFPIDTDETKCVYTDRVLKIPRLRGVMSPSNPLKEDDLKTLGAWGANLLRYQIVREWHARNNNQDRDEYLRWVDSKVSHLLEDVLPWARAAGVQVLVDLHVPPGGREEGGDMQMFYDKHHAETFLMAWTNIATRCVGKDGICGYDLINEPCQERVALKDCDYLTLQERAAKLVRRIDPATPIVVASNKWDSPFEFKFMRIFKMKDIIYQAHMYVPGTYTHQGVHAKGDNWMRVPYPSAKLDRETLLAALQPVRDFQQRHNAVIYIGEFSAVAWAEGAERYLADCISIFEEYDWHWSYHAFREWSGWSVEHAWTGRNREVAPSSDNPRKQALLNGFRTAHACGDRR